MNFDVDQFRTVFPEFSDPVKYPTATLNVFWGVACSFIDSNDCPYRMLHGDALRYALDCLTAHLLCISMLAQKQTGAGSTTGGVPGSAGYITSSHIDEITVTRMQPPATNGWQFWLNNSPYGQQLWALLSVLSVGGTSVGGLPEREGYRKVGGVFW